MSRFREVIGQKVLEREQAARIGTVASLIVDCSERRVVALRVRGVKGRKDLVHWNDVTGAGPDAVVISGVGALREATSERERQARAGGLDFLGKRVLTDRGIEAGTVQDVEFDPGSGALRVLLTTSGPLEADRLRALGSYAVIVRAQPISSRE